MVKHVSGLRLLFGPKLRLWHFEKEKLCYVTPYAICLQMCKLADYFYNECLEEPESNDNHSTKVIWDMFGGIGSDTIEWSKYFNVVTTEIDKKTYNLLDANVRAYKLKNVNILHTNCFNLLGQWEPDVIYYDPPWGDHYKSIKGEFSFEHVYLDYIETGDDLPKKVSCVDLVKYLYLHVCQKIVIKSPMNSTTFENLFGPNVLYVLAFPQRNLKFLYISGVKERF